MMKLLIATIAAAITLSIVAADIIRTSADVCASNQCQVHQWRLVERAQPHVLKTLVFAIKNSNEDQLKEVLDRVSDPDNVEFGNYLSFEQLGELVRNQEALEVVLAWLHQHGVRENEIEQTAHGEFLIVRTPILNAEAMLSAKFFVFDNELPYTSRVMRTEYISLPDNISQHIDFVGETVQFPEFKNMRVKSKGPVINSYVTPQLLNQVYGINNNFVKSSESTQSLFESLGQNYSPDDLTMFQKRLSTKQSSVAHLIGPDNAEACEEDPASCGEANLDVEYIMAIAQNSPTTFWSLEGDIEPFLDWVIAVANTKNPPLVHSISYGSVENNSASSKRFNTEIMKLGVRGVTVVVSSGDDGVANFPARDDPQWCGFAPSFPASCPYVVTVGATQGPESGKEETSCSSDTGGVITSGGGFSAIFERPSYQSEAVAKFFKHSNAEDLPPMNSFASGGRAYPDVSLLGYNYIIVDDQKFSAESGTSASAPVFAGMLALINGELLASGKPPVGFVNPLLYKLSKEKEVFNDITKGRNHCTSGIPPKNICCEYGFTACAGFDPVTGLGSVNFEALKAHILKKFSPSSKSRIYQEVGDKKVPIETS